MADKFRQNSQNWNSIAFFYILINEKINFKVILTKFIETIKNGHCKEETRTKIYNYFLKSY